MANLNDLLLEAVRNRKSKSEFNYGILTADRYVKTLQECVGNEACYKFACKGNVSFDDAMKKASKTLTYNNPDMVLEDIYDKAKQLQDKDGIGLELPKSTLMVFRHTLTTSRKDRDGDIIRTEGVTVDPNMLLLWQHVHTLPIGKMLGVAEHTKDSLSLISAIVDINELSHDAAVMIENKMGRFSHGFSADEFEKMEGEEDNPFGGFDITKASIMEESLVSIPANTDAEIEDVLLSLVEGGKLTSALMKGVGTFIREKRPATSSIKYKQKLGEFEETIETSNAADFEKIYKETRPDENEPRSGSDETKGIGTESTDDTSKETNGNKETKNVPKTEEVKSLLGFTSSDRGHAHPVFLDDHGDGETAVVDGHSHQVEEFAVGSEGDHIHTISQGSLIFSGYEGIEAKDAMAIFIQKSTSDERKKMSDILKALEDSAKQSVRTEEYKALVGS